MLGEPHWLTTLISVFVLVGIPAAIAMSVVTRRQRRRVREKLPPARADRLWSRGKTLELDDGPTDDPGRAP